MDEDIVSTYMETYSRVKSSGKCCVLIEDIVNMERAYTLAKRGYDRTMVGIFSQSTPPSANVGVSRQLPIDCEITSLRGYVKQTSDEELKDLASTKFFAPSEMLVTTAETHDDPSRLLMASTQSKHSVSTIGADRLLVGTGVDKSLAHMIGDDFAFKAKKNGKIVKIDEKNQIMIIKYKDGTHDDVPLQQKVEKNGGGGFYVPNTLKPIFKEGKTVKAGQCVAINTEFFTVDPDFGDVVYKAGPMARVAMVHSSSTFEDSTVVSEKLSEKMSSYIVQKAPITLGTNSNIDFMVKVGDKVKVNDPLVIYDESYDDSYTNKILANMGKDVSEDIIKDLKTPIVSKYNGEITDIKMYYTVPVEEFSESMQKILNKYIKDIKKKQKAIQEYVNINDSNTILQSTKPSIPDASGKIKGVQVGNGVLIEFFIKYKDKFGIGDKLTFFTALKAINHDIFPLGQEPYLASDPNKKIDAFIGFTSIMARMTNSFNIVAATTRDLLELKEKLHEIYEEEYGEKVPFATL